MFFLQYTLRTLLLAVSTILLLIIPAGALALDTFFVGPRAMGMGGANVASVCDTSAQYYNPAAFGFFNSKDGKGNKISCDNNNMGRKEWGLNINAAGGIRLHNDFCRLVDDLVDINRLDLNTYSVQSESDLVDLINLVNGFAVLDDPGNAITADVNAGLALRVNHFALGVRGFMQATGRVVEVDTQNLGLCGSMDINEEIQSIDVSGNDGELNLFTSCQIDQLRDSGLNGCSIQILDFLARREGVNPEDVQSVTDILEDLSIQTIYGLGGDLEDNTTTILLKGFGVAEIPLSYGYALNDHVSIGGNIKLMVGRVYRTEVLVFDKDCEDILKEVDNNYEESVNFGIDLGLMARFKMVNFGIVARNINAPKFDGPTVNGIRFDDVKIDPQVTAGLAFIPFETLTLETDIDLTENETTFNGYDTQKISFGLEWDAFRFLALRAGAYKNLAEDDIDWVITAGLGLNFWAMRLDVGGAFAIEKEEYDNNDVPAELRVAAQLSVDF